MVITLGHKKHTRNRNKRQDKFKRWARLLAVWTAFLTALAALVTALAELIHSLGKLLP